MELRQLRYFIAVAEARSFVGASERLGIAQPALSRQIRLLEEELASDLFERTPRGIVLTAAGKNALIRARRIMSEVDEFQMQFQSAATAPKLRIKLGVPPSFTDIVDSSFLEAHAATNPGVELYVQEMWTGQIAELLARKVLDLGILCQTQLETGYYRSAITTKTLYLISAAQPDTTPPEGPVRLAELADVPLVLSTPTQGMRTVLDRFFAVNGTIPHITHEADSWGILRTLVESGKASTILPRRELRAELDSGRLSARPLEPAPTNTFYLVAAEAVEADPIRRKAFDDAVALLASAMPGEDEKAGGCRHPTF